MDEGESNAGRRLSWPFGEELMFRGVGVQVFRRGGFGEGKVDLYSSLVFGFAHASNAIGHGAQAIRQAVIVSTSAYFFYLCLRVGGTILLPERANVRSATGG
ncbi:CPBP family intramembrane glutamic endopeptidase [Streptodolium elevatio]|uniref:CPBP family intramembrane glutamic endopeptidase n=1 Tax=Streptodolium elevatio TaxID=3157996 RepID=A0ABV3DEB3_9ACTN